MKKIILILVLLILIPKIDANTVTGYVFLEVINNPPEITALSLHEPYEDTDLTCNVKFKDEKDNIILYYKWYKNNNLIVDQNINILSKEYFNKNDIITCSVLPYDNIQYGQEKNISVQILPISLRTKIQTTFLNFFTPEEVTSKDLQKNSITGLTVSNIKNNPVPLFNILIYILLIIVILFTIINIKKHLYLKNIIEK